MKKEIRVRIIQIGVTTVIIILLNVLMYIFKQFG